MTGATSIAAVAAKPATAGLAVGNGPAGGSEPWRGVPAPAAVAAVATPAALTSAATGGKYGECSGEASDGDLGGLGGAPGTAVLAALTVASTGSRVAVQPVAHRLAQGEADHRRHPAGTGARQAGRAIGAMCTGSAIYRTAAAIHRAGGGPDPDVVVVLERAVADQVPTAEYQQVALHDHAAAGFDHQLTDVHHVQHVVPLVEPQQPGVDGEVPHLAASHATAQDAQGAGGER
jgi:hypothetical protein